MNDILAELEIYTGKLISGDITPIVYDMFKDSEDILGLIRYLDKQEGKVTDVYIDRPSETEGKDDTDRFDYEVWCSKCDVLESL